MYCQHLDSILNQRVGHKTSLPFKCTQEHQQEEAQFQTVYMCLHCGEFGCNRYSANQCMLKHMKKSGHFIVFNLDTLQIWCDKCEYFIDDQIDQAKLQSKTDKEEKSLQNFIELHQHFINRLLSRLGLNEKETIKEEVRRISVNPSVFGLVNLGNTCFFNSILQCLLASENFMVFLKEWFRWYPKDSLVYQLNEILQGNTDVRNPSNIFEKLKQRNKKFRHLKQQDAIEAYIYLMDIIEQEVSKVEKQTFYPQLGYYVYVVQCLKCMKREFFFEKNSFLFLDINPQIDVATSNWINTEIHKFSDQCDYIKKEEISMHKNVIDSQADINSLKISDKYYKQINSPRYLGYFFDLILINCKETGYRCEQCKENSDYAYKRYFLLKPPKVLTICFKRFQSLNGMGFKKNEQPVKLPEWFNLNYYLLEENGQIQNSEYKLYGSVQHMGTLNSGHYVSYVEKNGEWFYISDSHFSKKNISDVQDSQSYIAFYELIDSKN